MTFAEAYVKAYTGTGRMARTSWSKGCRLLARHPDIHTTKIEGEVILPSPEGWVVLPYSLTSEDFAATDWTAQRRHGGLPQTSEVANI